MKNKISIITVCYNAEMCIEATLKSVYMQNYRNIEYIIKDGGSTDKTNEIIETFIPQFEKKGIQIKYISKADKGIYAAMNEAVLYASGEWVIFMNAGDFFYNEYVLSDVFEKREWNGTDILYGHTLYRLSDKRAVIVNHSAEVLEFGWSLCHQSIFVKTEQLKQVPFDCQYRIVADYDQMLRLKKRGNVFTKVNTIISDVDREGVSNVAVAQRYRENDLLKKIYNLRFKKTSILTAYIKHFVRKLFPYIEAYFFEKRIRRKVLLYK